MTRRLTLYLTIAAALALVLPQLWSLFEMPSEATPAPGAAMQADDGALPRSDAEWAESGPEVGEASQAEQEPRPAVIRPTVVRRAPVVDVDERTAGLLGPYRDKYNIRSAISRLQQVPVDPTEGFRFVVFGDSRGNAPVWEKIAEAINRYDPVFAINTGDMVSTGTAREFAEYLLPTLEAKATSYEFLPVMGNHDSGDNGREYDYLFGADARVYHFHYGDSVFVVLDNGSMGVRMPWSEQLALADTWLAEPPNAHKFVSMHKPPANVSKWAYHAASYSESVALTKLMTKHEVDHVFAGHIHAYSTAAVGGVRYTVTGGGGAYLHNRFGRSGSVHHFIVVDVAPAGIKQQVVRF